MTFYSIDLNRIGIKHMKTLLIKAFHIGSSMIDECDLSTTVTLSSQLVSLPFTSRPRSYDGYILELFNVPKPKTGEITPMIRSHGCQNEAMCVFVQR